RCHSHPVSYRLLRPALFLLDAERAHRLAVAALRARPPGALPPPDGPLATTVAGLGFPNPLGMAAGFDKAAEAPDALLGLGRGFAEVGSTPPRPRARHPKPPLLPLADAPPATH